MAERVTIQEAAKCPKCKKEGRLDQNFKHTDEHNINWDVTTYICDNEICPWYNTGWVVQSDKNGVVYERDIGERGMDKDFPKLSPDVKSVGRMYLEDIVRRDLEAPHDPENPHEIHG